MRILGIETSCDETGVAIYDTDQGLLSHALFSQVDMHAHFGGVVPELASRDHIRRIVPLIKEVSDEANIHFNAIDGIAYTEGPGLVGALLVGISVAHGLSWSLQIPAVGIHHMEGHLLACMLEEEKPKFPFIALLVSGGHTQLVKVEAVGRYTIMGESLDDAVGEAFDKTAKLLGLGYPGGPVIEKIAREGHAGIYNFPRPMINRPGLDFSFSGLKTFAKNTWEESRQDQQTKADIARAFSEAVFDTLFIKCQRAIQQTGLRHLVVAGGVSANRQLRARFRDLEADVFYPRLEFCTDNGAMIAYAGAIRLVAGEQKGLSFGARPRWSLDELQPPAHLPENS